MVCCPSCNSSPSASLAVADDGRTVCTGCGFVVEESSLEVQGQAADQPALFRNLASWQRGGHVDDKDHTVASLGRLLGKRAIKRIGSMLDVNKTILKESQDLFIEAFENKEFYKSRRLMKDIMAACSVFITCRKYNTPITIIDICEKANCETKKFGSMLLRMTRELKITVKPIDLLELAKSKYNLARLENSVSLRALEILEICHKIEITEGTNRENQVTAAAYLSWLSFKPISRWRINLEQFCKDYKFPHCRAAVHVSNVIAGILYRLASQIPWVNKNTLTMAKVAMYTSDVKQYLDTLMLESRAVYEASFNKSIIDKINNHEDTVSESFLSSLLPNSSDVMLQDGVDVQCNNHEGAVSNCENIVIAGFTKSKKRKLESGEGNEIVDAVIQSSTKDNADMEQAAQSEMPKLKSSKVSAKLLKELKMEARMKPMPRQGVSRSRRYNLGLTNNIRFADEVMFHKKCCSQKRFNYTDAYNEICEELWPGMSDKNEEEEKSVAKYSHNLDSPELGEEDIGDEELSQYLLGLDS